MTEIKRVEVTNKKNALFAVSEYGEFSSLLDVAKLLQERLGYHPVFLFKHDYGMLSAHSRELHALRFSWASSAQYKLHGENDFERGVDDYIAQHKQHSITRPKKTVTVALACLLTILGILLIPLAVVRAVVRAVVFSLMKSARWCVGPRLRSILHRLPIRSTLRRLPIVVMWRYKILLERVERIFDRFEPVIVISGQDYPLSITAMAAKVAQDRGKRTVIIPFSMVPTTKEIAESFAGADYNRLRRPIVAKLMASSFPKWVNRYRGANYIRLSIPEVFTAEALHLSPPAPWTPNSGRGVVLLPGQQGYEYSLAAGIAPENARITGALWADQLYCASSTREERRRHLIHDIENRTSVNLASISDVVLVSWPPNQAPREPTGLESYDQLCQSMIDLLANLANLSASMPVRIAVSLHPTLAKTDLVGRLQDAKIHVVDRPLVEVIDCCDLFIATVSSTLMWSLQLGIPSINFDVYRYQYREFTQAGLEEVYSMTQLRHLLMKLIGSPVERAKLQSRMRANREYWGLFDGRSADRIVAEISKLATD